MTASNTYGRQVVVPLTNKSGGSVAAGDVVIYDSTTNLSFTTTTSANSLLAAGIAQETIANNAAGRVLTSGYASLVNVNASVTRLNFGATFTVAKQATDVGSSRAAGTFMRFLSTSATPDAYVYPVDLAGAALTNPMTTVGDIIQGTTAGAPARLAAGTAGQILTAAGAATSVVWAGFVGVRAKRTTNQSISNVTYTAVQCDAEDYDTDTFHDNVTNNTRLTVPTGKGGYYAIKAEVGFANNATGSRQALIKLNGTTFIGATVENNAGATDAASILTACDYALVATDYVEVYAYQASGGALNVDHCRFQMFRAGV